MASITDMLHALRNPDPAIRVPAEQAVTQAKEADLASFIITVLHEFRDDSKPQVIRHMAGTLLKNAVAPSLREVAARRALEERWKTLPGPVRKQVKDEVLSTLASTSREVRSVAANIIGSLSRIELPAGEWPDLIAVLVGAARSTSEMNQEAALTTIGYICEEGHDHEEVEDVLKPSTTEILSVIVAGMESANEDVKFAATNALCNAMEYIDSNMEQQEQRDYLVDALCTTASTCVSMRTRERAMESLVKVAEMCYSSLEPYIARLHEITRTAVVKDDESVGLQALQFWISICETERCLQEEGNLSECRNFSIQALPTLLELCLQLLVQQEEDQTGDDWNLSIAGGKLLQSLTGAVGLPVQAPVMNFVYANISSEQWRHREAAVMALGCVIGVDDPAIIESMQDTAAQAVPGLLKYMRDSNAMVADTSAWVTAVVCEYYVAIFLDQPQSLQQLLNIVGPMIGDVQDARMGMRACHIVHNLALAYEEEEGQVTNELSPYFKDLVQVLLTAIDGGSTSEFKSQAQETLNVLVDAAAEDSVGAYLTLLAPQLLERLSGQMEHYRRGHISLETETMVGLLCGSISALARKLDQRFQPFVDAAMALLTELISFPLDTVQEEALVAISSIAYVSKTNMGPYLAKVVEYALQCVQHTDEPDSVYAVVGAIGDLCLSCRTQLQPYVSAIMNTLYQCLLNTEVDRDHKCAFLKCFGDVILNVLGGNGFVPFMATLMPLTDEMFHASCSIDIRGDPDSEEYVMSLWEATATLYSSVVQSFSGDSEKEQLMQYLPNMLKFSLHAGSHSTEYPETMIAAVVLIGDMASVLCKMPAASVQQARMAIAAPATMECVSRAEKSVPKEDRMQLRWVQDQLGKLGSHC